ncbi:MAG: ABC transporter ATP-binding protein [Clostridiales bacterium]|nr:ABC transporter ATP-binding protein [Clostridiales bacterium]
MAEIVLTNVTKRWGQFYAVDDLSLTIPNNAFVTLLGPSGCGKTTTLRMIAGLETPTSGRITIDGVPVFDSQSGINVPPNRRKVGFLFQNYALWPNMTVYQNIAFGLSNLREDIPEVDPQARVAAEALQALAQPEALADLLAQGQANRRHPLAQRLMERFDIGEQAARELSGLDPRGLEAARAALRQRLEEATARQAAQGVQLNERQELVVDGQVKTQHRKYTREEIDRIVRRVSRVVKIGMFMERYPSELSGGQQQRVAIARTLAPNPRVLFMDEPLSNLDAKLRLEMRSELQRLHLETGSTFIYVTHDQLEAMTLASRICLMDNGVLQQYEKPLTVYNRPANLFVADFVGNPAVNFIQAQGQQEQDGRLRLTLFDGLSARFVPEAPFDLAEVNRQAQAERDRQLAAEAAKEVPKANKNEVFTPNIAVTEETETGPAPQDENGFVLGVRPEFLLMDEEGELEGEVFSAMPTGMETTVRVRLGRFLLTGVIFGGVLFTLGQRVRFRFQEGKVMLFGAKHGQQICLGTLRFDREQ